ncbi:MAG: hypothetical protein K0Q49_1841 [Haloplasmataceae bacterium]|jgi:hypothetical protein|nr:hypothetical protein [Haloplasmataceae bacterium]
MKNIDEKMKQLVTDYNILSYLHDLLSYSKKHEEFYTSETYIELHENDHITIFKYLKRMIITLVSFIFIICLIRSYLNIIPISIMYILIIIVSLIYGKLIVLSKNDIKDLSYQLKAKKAAQFALENYNYEQFLFFLDKYLSELSSKSYNNQLNSKNIK